MKKTIISVILIISLLVNILIQTIYPIKSIAVAGTATFRVSSTKAIVGDEVTISIDMLEESEFAAGNFALTYDNTKLEYISSEKGEILNTGLMSLINPDTENSKISIAYTANPTDTDQTKQAGNLLTVTFRVIDGAGENANLDFACTMLKTKNGTVVNTSIESGKIQILNITMNKQKIEINRGNTEKLSVIVAPNDAVLTEKVTWKSNDENIVKVDDDGNVTALKIGTTKIIATYLDLTTECTVDVKAYLESISLNKSETTIIKGNKEELSVIYNPTDTTDDKTVIWTSSNEQVATVDEDGSILTIGAGKTTITAKVKDKIAECIVNVRIPLETIALNKTEITLNKGESETVSVAIYNPTDTTDDKTVVWSSLNEEIAKIDDNGNILAVGTGNTTIKAKVGETIEATCQVKVLAPLQSISIDKQIVTMPERQYIELNVIYNPIDTTDNKQVTWTSSNQDVATVNGNGRVTALKEGTTNITANVNGKIATTEIIVAGYLGDFDKDNMRTSFDAYKALETSIKETNPDETKMLILDIDGDRKITSFDAYKILEYSIGIIDSKYWK